ncbi:fatty acid synthase [Osmia lignaria lignaria]|uniref:fatty acid synthase n=1 Tax=Osmia lignaria lignaria TaxID=1437193 RepID=UPI00402BB91B
MDFEDKEKEFEERYKRICGKNRLSSKYESQKEEKTDKGKTCSKEKEEMEKELNATKCDLASLQRSLGGDRNIHTSQFNDAAKDVPKECSSFFEFKFQKRNSAQFEKYSKEKNELEVQLEDRKKEVKVKEREIFELKEKIKRLEAFSKERDILEKELISTKAELTGIKRTLELERQERRDLETRALGLIKDAKRKWENAEKDKIAQLNKHIEAQTVRITELCTSNNEMSSRLQRTECELETANAELHKLRVFQMQYKESLAKTRELNRQSAQGVETKLKEIAARAHNQLAELRSKLDLETAKNSDLESKLRNEQDSNHCRQSRLNVALELAQNELMDCQEQLRSIQATIPARDAEIEALKKQLQERSKQLDNVMASEQVVATMQEQLERSRLENEQLKQQLQAMKSDLSETMMNLEQNEALALNLEQATQDKAALQKRLQDSLEKEEEHLRKVGNLEELLRRLEQSVTKLESENANLKMENVQPSTSMVRKTDTIKADILLEEQIHKLEQELRTAREHLNTERQTAKQAQINLWKKEKELSDANLDKRIAIRASKKAEEKIETLQEEKQRLSERLDNKIKEEDEKSKKLLKELDSAKASLNDITKESSRNKMQADSAQRALTQANHQIEELQSSSASLRRELDAARKQARASQERVDSLNAENKRLSQLIAKHNEEKSELESKIEKLEQEIKGYELNTELLKETCTVLEEQLTDYERLTSDHETRENILIQDKMKLQKDLEATEGKLREACAAQNEERSLRLAAERNIERLESETSDIECEKNGLLAQRDQYKKLVQELSAQVDELSAKCSELEYEFSETKRNLEMTKAETRVVKEESSQHLTRVHELKEANTMLMNDLQSSVDQGQELRMRISELESILEEMRQFYQEREVKAESTRQQQTKLIDYLQFKLEECSKKKKTVCDKILGTKQKENVPPSGTGMPVGYRELENQLAKERAKVKTLTDQLLALRAIRQLVSCKPGEEVVITGIAGRFPECNNVMELKTNLLNKKDLITENYSRWRLDHAEIPRDGGKLTGLSKFDAIFFGVHYKQAHTLDPMCRMLLEHSYEALIDAGINPRQLRGTNTAVVIGSCISESEKTWFYEKLQANGFGITGCSRAMLANRISYFLGLHGPSYAIDTACSSSLFALDHAYRMIRTGICDTVIIGGSNLCLHPYVSLQFARLGVLSSDCRCKSFDARANGYVRSEAVSVIVLQKAKNAKRIYAQVVYTKTNCDGYKEQGITFPASEVQKMLLRDFYNECKIPPTILSYLEAHGTGTSVGDPEELNAINSIFCQGRKTPLKMGSVKSNMGHTEPASGICSVAKIIIAMETGLIPPNLHFKSPMKGIKCLEEGKVQVVTDPTPWEGGYAGINSFGFGGANAHVLLKSYAKEKVNNGAPSDNLPRLVVASGRTEEAMNTLLNYVESIPVDVEYIRLLHEVYAENITGHMFRGYTVVGSKISDKPPREIQEYSGLKRPVWFVFSGMGSQWPGMGEALMRFPIFAQAIKKCDAALRPHGVDIVDIITNKDRKTFDNILNSFIGIAAIQIGLVDLLTAVGIVPDNIIGHSVGELGCAYADGCFTAEQMILSAYSRGLASIETKMIRGSMAAIGLGYEDIKDMCPPDIEVACHNGPDSSTISGPVESMKEFVAKLQANKIFAKEVPCSNIAYHSRYIAEAGPKLLAYLRKVIPEARPRSSKWLSTSVPRNQWSSPAAKYSSAEYHTNNLLNSVLFAETASMIPADAITIEIAPHGLLQAILKRSLDPNVTNVPLTQRGHKDNAEFFLQALGKVYNCGLQPQLANIYPHVEFPVSRGTPMISPHIRWEHSEDWFVPVYSQRQRITTSERTVEIALKDENYEYMMHHVIDGRNLVPATGYLILVWETISLLEGKLYDEVPVVFENIKFERATTISADGSVQLTIMVQKGSGKFEISEGSSTVVSGTIRKLTNPSQEKIAPLFLTEIDDEEALTEKDIYKELKLRGYDYTGLFRALKSASIKGTRGRIAWMKNWATFMDNMLQIKLLGIDTRTLYVPTAIQKLVIDVKLHNDKIRCFTDDANEFSVQVYNDYDAVISGGIEIRGLKANAIQRRKLMSVPVLEEYKFVPNRDKAQTSLEEMIVLSTHLALDSNIIPNAKIMELVNHDDDIPDEEVLAPVFVKVLGDLPMFRLNMVLAAESKRCEKISLSENVTIIEPNKLPEDGSIFMAAAYNIFSKKRHDILEQLLLAITDYGFILIRETMINNNAYLYLQRCGLNIVLEKSLNNETLLLLKKQEKPPQRTEVVYVNNNEFSWLEKVKETLKNYEKRENNETVRLVLVAEGDLENGALGLIKCLRREPNGEIAKAVIIQDKNAPKFSLNDPFYAKQLDIDIAINILRPGKIWGTYRHVPYPPLNPIPVFHGYANLKVRGDLNSIQWMQGAIQPDDKNLVKVVYSSLNFRDVMLATGKLMPEAITKDRLMRDCLIGFEFSGIDSNGRRVMGFVDSRAITNLVTPGKFNVWPVPDEWSLEDAATVPSAYFTVFYAFFHFGKLRKDEKVLIHSGSGAVGQAAINIALAEGCEVFTTVGTPEKRKFIRETFPSIDDDHIGNSRDTSFEQMVMKQTNGKGVDIVLNSLSEDKLLASVRCLCYRGRFLEIGKFDLASNNPLGMEIFLKEISFHGIMLDSMINGVIPKLQEELHHFVNTYLYSKAVKPLIRKCFERHQVEDAFRYMAAGKHIGKILIKVGDEKEPLNTPISAYPRFNASPNKSYVIVGGLGGLGLEVADWLVVRGAMNLVIVSRGGIKNGYQRMRTETWKSYGVKVLIISGVDLSKTNDCEFTLRSAEKQAPVDGIFNLAAILKDCLIVNQTETNFEESMKPKAGITKKLDEVSRKICPKLRHFVVFSSLSCGRGMNGQANYGMGNSVSERICEKRVEEGLPGMAIEWGVIGEVGLAADMWENKQELIIGGTLQQKVSSCLAELDKFLSQSRPIVASMVVAEKRPSASEASNVLEAVMNIMSIKDLKTVSQSSSLSELGMDSMMAVEIKQTLERDFEVFLTAQDIRVLNIAKLVEMSAKDTKKQKKQVTKSVVKTEHLNGMRLLMKTLNVSILNTEPCVELPIKCGEKKNEIFLIPGIEGSASIFYPLTPFLKFPATVLQSKIYDTDQSVEEMAERLLPHVLERSKGRRDFVIVGYSYGSIIAIELARRLEAHGLVGHLILIDGSPDYMRAIRENHFEASTHEELQDKFLVDILNFCKSPTIAEFKLELDNCTTWYEKLEKMVQHTPPEVLKVYTPENQKTFSTFLFNRLCAIDKYNPTSLPPLRTPITLLKPTLQAVQLDDHSYGCSKLTYGKVNIYVVEGNHISMLDNSKVPAAINGEPLDDNETFKNTLNIVSSEINLEGKGANFMGLS